MLVSAVCQHKSAISIHIFFPSWTSSHLPTHPPPLGCHRAPGWTSCVIQQLPRLAIYFTHGSVYMSLLLSQFIPPSPSPVLQIGSSVPFSRLHIYALICDICFSLSDFLLPVQQVLGSSTTLQWTQIHSFLWLIFHCIYVPIFCVCAQSCLTPCNPVNCTPPGSLSPWDFPGKNTGVGCHFLSQGIILTQRLNPLFLWLLHWQAGSLPLSHQGSPEGRVAYCIFWLTVKTNA